MFNFLLPGSTHFEPGRYGATQEEIEAFFVNDAQFANSSTRSAIWTEWKIATEFLSNFIPIACVWLAGSFASLKLDPSDIDCLYWIKAEDIAKAKVEIPEASQVIEIFSKSQVKNSYNLRVDSYIATWRPIPEPKYADYLDEEYYLLRGHWDDFWQRNRFTPEHLTPTIDDTFPRRGYLEVKFNGFE